MRAGDEEMPGLAEAPLLFGCFARAGLAHAEVVRLDLDAARASAGVRLLLDAKALAELGFVSPATGPNQPPLAGDVLRYVGEPVALIIAETAAQARAAADLVALDLIERPEQHQLLPGGAAIHPDLPGNLGYEHRAGPAAEVAAALQASTHRVMMTVNHSLRESTARTVQRARLDWNAGPSGAAARSPLRPEHICLTLAARQLSQRICWLDAPLPQGQSLPEMLTEAEIGFDADFRITALRVNLASNLGAYAGQNGLIEVEDFAAAMTGDYDIGLAALGALGVHTNSPPPQGAGGGRLAAVMTLERLIETAARQLRIDPIALRLRNLRQDLPTPMAALRQAGGGRGHACQPGRSGLISARIGLLADGCASLQLSTADCGNSAALLAEATGLAPDRIRLLPGRDPADPDLQAEAVRGAIAQLITGLTQFLQQDAGIKDVQFQGDDFTALGSNMRLSLAEAADWAREEQRADLLEATATAGAVDSPGLHLAEVGLDAVSGALQLTRYWPEAGADLAARLLQELCHQEPDNGTESAIVSPDPAAMQRAAAVAAIVNAIDDALTRRGFGPLDLPLDPRRLQELLKELETVDP